MSPADQSINSGLLPAVRGKGLALKVSGMDQPREV